MRKSLLNLYMQKVASGDLNYLDRLCKQLADRLVFAPVISSSKVDGSNSKTTFSVLRINDHGRSLVPLFTTERRFKEWSQKSKHEGSSISLLGADFCAALGAGTWIMLDKGFEDAIELDPVFVAKVSAADGRDPAEDDEDGEIPNRAPTAADSAPALERGLARGALFSSEPLPEEYVPRSIARAGTQPAVAAPRAPDPEDSPEAEASAKQSSKFMRSAVFSSEPLPSAPPEPAPEHKDEEPGSKKKRSFLSFLKGS